MSCGFQAKIKTPASVHSLIRVLAKLTGPCGEPRLDFEFAWFWGMHCQSFFLHEGCMHEHELLLPVEINVPHILKFVL